ncbi:diguanylate cyclase [Pseudoxanthomonas mexicana]|uniref:GGDEF domain-containing protein n=1 Tax=Pseudoxanthomonas mexicana TaxID=128785 RepID=UPI00398B9609
MNLRTRDFRLEIITLLGLSTALVIGSFAIYRWLRGELLVAGIDLAIVGCILAPVSYARLTGDSRRAGKALCLINSAACVAANHFIGAEALTWVYLVLLTNFFIADGRFALVVNLLMMGLLWLLPGSGTEGFHAIPVLATAALTTLFSYLFAVRIQDDRSQLQTLAAIDALSGVPNRRTMERVLAQVVADRRGERRYGLVVLDVDHFKEVNDRYGHAAGDAAIADLAAILRFEMRRGDQVFRFGGEEFVMLLRVDDRHALETAAERLRKAVRNSLRGPGGRITVSLGAAMLACEEDWHDWFSRADAALYRAKSGGRDSCMMADDLF